jgi:monoamine oxidase
MAGLTMTGCAESKPAATYETKYTCDVVIAGGGIAGLAAAVSAAEAGANVILVEASAKVGGTSRFAAGAFGPRFGTDWEAAYAKAPMSDIELGKMVVEGWDPYVAWIEGLGLTIEPLGQGAYVWMGGERQGQGSKSFTDEYLQQFGQIFTDKGGTTLTSTRAIKVLTDEKGAAASKLETMATIVLPNVDEIIAPMVFSLPIQLLAYHTAVFMGTDVDQPRNLAKSVTVE